MKADPKLLAAVAHANAKRRRLIELLDALEQSACFDPILEAQIDRARSKFNDANATLAVLTSRAFGVDPDEDDIEAELSATRAAS